MRDCFSFCEKGRAKLTGVSLSRAVNSAATVVHRRPVAASNLCDTFYLYRNQIEPAILDQEFEGLLAADVMMRRLLPGAVARLATNHTSAILERLGEATL
ncbi:hypothetical protein [Bradyrhizobium sp. Cp5.3]|uniref:hypothetical protein n=1 Tax=Bradyrhizobium sp. Cp5.3 TaxID=443598 RepID=UPI0012ECA3C3|nr:hypothetical protein [Bradyrhizobium sp. Cp5.3]